MIRFRFDLVEGSERLGSVPVVLYQLGSGTDEDDQRSPSSAPLLANRITKSPNLLFDRTLSEPA